MQQWLQALTGSAWKISGAPRRTESFERNAYWPGPKLRVDSEAILRLLESKPDLYLRDLQAELKFSTGVQHTLSMNQGPRVGLRP